MFNKKILIFLILLLSIICLSTVSAADNITEDTISLEEVNTESISVEQIEKIGETENDDVLKEGNNSFGDLANLINDAPSGSTITLDRDYVNNDDYRFTGIKITKDITIDGQGHTLDANRSSRMFEVEDGHNVVQRSRDPHFNGHYIAGGHQCCIFNAGHQDLRLGVLLVVPVGTKFTIYVFCPPGIVLTNDLQTHSTGINRMVHILGDLAFLTHSGHSSQLQAYRQKGCGPLLLYHILHHLPLKAAKHFHEHCQQMLLGGEIVGQIACADIQSITDRLWCGSRIPLFQKQLCRRLNNLVFGGVYASSRHTVHLLP